jgi:anti-sigma factor RsiW
MHPVIENGLEEYLSGTMGARSRDQFDAHLTACPRCREAVQGMKEISALFESVRPVDDAPVPADRFYARVVERIEGEERGSIWLALLQPAFARRVAFASLLLLASLGGFLVSREVEDVATVAPTPEMILAVDHDDIQVPEVVPTRDKMLVTLVNYK